MRPLSGARPCCAAWSFVGLLRVPTLKRPKRLCSVATPVDVEMFPPSCLRTGDITQSIRHESPLQIPPDVRKVIGEIADEELLAWYYVGINGGIVVERERSEAPKHFLPLGISGSIRIDVRARVAQLECRDEEPRQEHAGRRRLARLVSWSAFRPFTKLCRDLGKQFNR